MKKLIAFLLLLGLFFSTSLAEEGIEYVYRIPHTVSATTDIHGFSVNDTTILGSYTGETKNGVPNGYGLFEFNDIGLPCHYLGKWENGVMCGYGGLYWALGDSMVGEFKDNVMIKGQVYVSPQNSFRDATKTENEPLKME